MALMQPPRQPTDVTTETEITFAELPYAEGTLYVSIEMEGRNIAMKGLEIEGDSATFKADLTDCSGKEISIKAFQDLNGNRKLDMDSYGRPTEPCLQTTFFPASDNSGHTFRLIQY